MTPPIPSLRYERKFVANGVGLHEILALVKRHRCVFDEAYPARLVTNIYLDSPGLGNYHDHIEGTANRSKTRVRWYGQQRGAIERPTLERKIKRGVVSRKEAHPLPPFCLNGGPTRSLLETVFSTAVLPEMLRSVLHRLEPSLFNCYRRHYFLSRDRRFRLTVDSDLKFAGSHGNNGPSADSVYHSSFVIIELKYPLEVAKYADEVSNAFPFRLTRCSKYVLGIECTAVA